jgi:plastocyanin
MPAAGATQVAWICALACIAATTDAGTLTAIVTDRAGSAVRDAAVYAVPKQRQVATPVGPFTAVMDQRDQRFVPHVLVVEVGTAVEFPNYDTVRHHVYSFSDAKSFELSLYSGRAHAPMVFDKPGVVDVGCNIHDQMEAHIVVVDTPYFAVTSETGTATLAALPAGDYSVVVYTPRLAATSQPAPRDITISSSAAHLAVQIEKRLRPPHDERNESLQWSHY